MDGNTDHTTQGTAEGTEAAAVPKSKRPHEMTQARKAGLAKANATRQANAARRAALRNGGKVPKVAQPAAPTDVDAAADDTLPVVPYPAEPPKPAPKPADNAHAEPPKPPAETADVSTSPADIAEQLTEKPAPAEKPSVLQKLWDAVVDFGAVDD